MSETETQTEANQEVLTQHTKVESSSERKPLSDAELANRLMEANRSCIERTIPLVQMLGRAKQQFLLYADSHKAKGTEEGDEKAATNQGLANEIDEVLTQFRISATKDPVSED